MPTAFWIKSTGLLVVVVVDEVGGGVEQEAVVVAAQDEEEEVEVQPTRAEFNCTHNDNIA